MSLRCKTKISKVRPREATYGQTRQFIFEKWKWDIYRDCSSWLQSHSILIKKNTNKKLNLRYETKMSNVWPQKVTYGQTRQFILKTEKETNIETGCWFQLHSILIKKNTNKKLHLRRETKVNNVWPRFAIHGETRQFIVKTEKDTYVEILFPHFSQILLH